jgi:type II secretory pathway pseudopilin PulG
MEIALAALSLVCLALLVALVVLVRYMGALTAAAAVERAQLIEQATDERRELLTRVQHPQVIVEKRAPVEVVTEAPEPDDYDLVGVVQDVPVKPDPGDEAAPA